MSATIALVDDDRNILTSVSIALEAEGFKVRTYNDGADALKGLAAQPADLVVLDIKMPRLDGMETLQRLRRGSNVPVIFLTSKDDEIDEALGLKMGADDYITKPFNPRELVARVRAVLRRAEARPARAGRPEASTIEAGPLRIEVGGREVFVDGEGVQLTPKEFDLLVTLIENRGLVLTREQLLERVWGFTFLGDSRTIDVHVRQLRRKLGDACPIQTVWGTGYKVPAKR